MPASLRAVLFYVGVSFRPNRDAGRRPRNFSQLIPKAPPWSAPLGVEQSPRRTDPVSWKLPRTLEGCKTLGLPPASCAVASTNWTSTTGRQRGM